MFLFPSFHFPGSGTESQDRGSEARVVWSAEHSVGNTMPSTGRNWTNQLGYYFRSNDCDWEAFGISYCEQELAFPDPLVLFFFTRWTGYSIGIKPQVLCRSSHMEQDGSGGFPLKRVMCSRCRNSCPHPEKHHSRLLLFSLLLATQARRWWFTSLCTVSLVPTLIKKSRKPLLLEMAASLLRFGVPSLFLSYILIAIIKKKKISFLSLSIIYTFI